MVHDTYAVVDLETTGHSSAKGDRIIQIAIVFIENGQIGKTYSRFVHPEKEIPAFIQELTTISDEEVAQAPRFEEIAKEVASLLEGTVFVAHNTDFDLSFLQNEFKRCGLPAWKGKKIDTVELVKILYPTAPSYRLQDITEELGIPLNTAHRADDDAMATAQLLLTCYRKLCRLPEKTLALLHRRSFHLKSDLSFLIFEALKYARRSQSPSSIHYYRGIPYVASKCLDERQHNTIEFPETVEEKRHLFIKSFPSFEQRDAQFAFMDAVWDALKSNREIVAEVPTGIGKTVGYLLPAILYAKEKHMPVVISTYTNHLVDKIIADEINKVSQMIGAPIKVTVLKGVEQYFSFNRFEKLLLLEDVTYDESFTIMQVLVWLTETTTGDLSELTVSGGGQLVIDRMRKQHGPLIQEEAHVDFHYRHVLNSEKSDLIVTNHATLLADLQRQVPFFKKVNGVIIDEAHQFEQTAAKNKKVIFSYTNWKYVLGQLSSEADGQLLPRLQQLHAQYATHIRNEKEQLEESFQHFITLFDEVMNALSTYPAKKNNGQHFYRQSHLLREVNMEHLPVTGVATALTNYIQRLEAYGRPLLTEVDRMSPIEKAYVAEWEYWLQELTIKAGEWIELFIDSPTEKEAVWLERDMRSLPGSLMIVKSPMVGTTIVRQLMEKLHADQFGVVWTSGTLTIEGNDRYIANQLGVSDHVPVLKFEAPPQFYKGSQIMIVQNMPDIQQVSQNEYIEAVADAVVQTVLTTGGKLFVLFTSQEMLRKTVELIQESEQLEEYALFAQGVTSGSRMKLLRSFRQFQKSVLFGTNSFWEGVDVPGEALSAVIVVRLPFSSPEEPLFKAKADQISKQGENPFVKLSLPEAVMRMRQGFGRLVRASSDKGVFIILDRRIETKSYGEQFLQSLPNVPIKKVTLEHMVHELENCYNE